MVLVDDPKHYAESVTSSPPSYDAAMRKKNGNPQTPVYANSLAGTSLAPSYTIDQRTLLPTQVTHSGGATLYHSIDPFTNKVVDSPLPPDHPVMQCIHDGHVPHSRFGIGGVVAAVLLFPLGFWKLMADREVSCIRCGMTLKPASHPSCRGRRRRDGSRPNRRGRRFARHTEDSRFRRSRL